MGTKNRHVQAAAAAVLTLATQAPTCAHAAPHALQTQHLPAAATTANFAGAVPAAQPLHLAITLPMHNQPMLDRLLRDLQDRRSPSFRHYLSVAEFTSRFGPTAAEYATLQQFAGTHGLAVRATAANRFVLDVEAPVATIEKAFNVHLGLYRHPDGTRLFMAPDREPTMDIATPVLHVDGLTDFSRPVPRSTPTAASEAARQGFIARTQGTAPNGSLSGIDIRHAYLPGTTLTGAGQTLALVEFQGYNIADINLYLSSIGLAATVPVVPVSLDGISPVCTGKCSDYEAVIDVEQVVSVAPGLKQVTFYIGDTIIDILNRIATDNTAKQISSSYGWGPEALVEDPVYKEFQAQGQSFLDGSGDMGYQLKAGGVWPADDGNVTGVGGTNLGTQYAGGPWQSETGWSLSGGGASPDNVKIGAWQKPFVNAMNKAAANRRNVPDVALEAAYDNFACWQGNCAGNNGGTSFSAPRWAAIIALVNQQAAASAKPPVGFLNPTLYAIAGGAGYASDFHDITVGFNGRYPAVAGYDLVTGLGSPQTALVNALLGQ